MLANIRRRNENLGERNRVVGQEVELEVVLGVGVRVDDACDVDYEADRLDKMWVNTDSCTSAIPHTNLAM